MIGRLVIGFVILAQAVLLGYELVAHYDSTGRQVALAVTNVVSLGAVVLVNRFLQRRYGITVHWIVYAIIATSVWLDAVGNFQHAYARFWWWDRLTHAIGGLAATAGTVWVCVALWRAGRFAVSWRIVLLYAFVLAQSAGAAYEISEWVGDELFGTHRVQGPFDAPRDLAMNFLGGLAVLMAASFWHGRQRGLGHGRG